MDVELPTTGCNILNSSTTFYNYSSDSRTRETYIIYDGEAHLQSSTYNQYGYSYSGDCLSTGDLVYKPELQVWFNLASIFVFISILLLAVRLFFYPFWRKLR